MEEPLKRLMQELGNAINDSLSESDRIAEAIGEIKRAGYDVFLVLEATIGFNKRDENAEDDEDEDDAPPRKTEAVQKYVPPPDGAPPPNIKYTSQDHRFLRSLKIGVDDEG